MKQTSRTKAKGEVFTPSPLVSEIYDQLPEDVWKLNHTFCDPACGDGVFLRLCKLRLLKLYPNELQRIIFNQLYGAEIMMDNAMDTIFNILFTNPKDDYPSEHAKIHRVSSDKSILPLHLSLEENDLLIASKYIYEDKKVYIRKTTTDRINIKKKFIGVKRELIENEINNGIVYFNFKIDNSPWVTFPNVVCCDSLKYGFTFGREPEFRLT